MIYYNRYTVHVNAYNTYYSKKFNVHVVTESVTYATGSKNLVVFLVNGKYRLMIDTDSQSYDQY